MGTVANLITSVRGALESPSPRTVAEALVSVGWPRGSLDLNTGREGIVVARLGGQPKMLISSGEDVRAAQKKASDVNPLSMGYSSEAPYTLLWTPELMQLHRTTFWVSRPGDAPLLEDPADNAAATANLLELLSPGSIAADEPRTQREVPGNEQLGLAEKLGAALAGLRGSVAAGHADDPRQFDLLVMRLFHQLLFIRFVEDRHPVTTVRRVEDVLEATDVPGALDGILRYYSNTLRSELFTRPAMPVEDVGPHALTSAIVALTEPWTSLRLDFRLTPNDVSGRLYETYLGMRPAVQQEEGTLFPTIGSTDDRSQRGSFYTPMTVATELARSTLLPWLEHNTPEKPGEVRVLDPACGSGAFLLASYRVLRDYFEQRKGGSLDQEERRDLLSRSIFGADADESALMLAQVALYEEADLGADSSLPAMGENLLHGDSLTSPPGAAPQGGVIWSDVIAKGGKFHVALTNPPFGAQRTRAERATSVYRKQLRAAYAETHTWGTDLAYYFVALAFDLLTDGGVAGFVLPRKVVSGGTAARIRSVMAQRGVRMVQDYRGARLFPSVAAYVALITVGGPPVSRVSVEEVRDSRVNAALLLDQDTRNAHVRSTTVSTEMLASAESWTAFELRWKGLGRQLSGPWRELGRVPGLTVVSGIQTGDDKRFVLEPDRVSGRFVTVAGVDVPKRYCPRFIKGPDVLPFRVSSHAQRRVVLPFKPDTPEGPSVLPVVIALGGYPTNPQLGTKMGVWLKPKVLLRAFGVEPAAALDENGSMVAPKGTAGAFAIAQTGAAPEQLRGMVAYLNSAFAQWWLRGVGEPRADESVELPEAALRRLPWPELSDQGWSTLAEAGEKVLLTLASDDPRLRATRWWDARSELDNLTMDLMQVSAELRVLVLGEIVRQA